MATIVQKYGGSSVADVAKVKQVAGQIVARKRGGDKVVVVVSAMGKSTDGLIEQALAVSAQPSQRELDMLVTAGERISMALLSMAIQEAGEQAISFTGSQSGIITNNNHQGAKILEVRPYRIEAELEAGRIVIVAGYQGVSLEREVTTLGRGGSDTSAVALAAALGADACEIYSDVDGVYSADPNVCAQARLLPELRYECMQTMAGVGAKVLNADAVDFARRAGIAIYARKTGDTQYRQTCVSDEAPEPRGVVAVVGAKKVTRLGGRSVGVAELMQEVTRAGGRCLGAHLGSDVDLWVDRTDMAGGNAAPLHALAQSHSMVPQDVAAVSLVGHALLSSPGVMQGALESLETEGVGCHAILAADTCICIAVPTAQCDEAVRRLHTRLVG